MRDLLVLCIMHLVPPEAAAPAEEPKPKKRGRKTKAEKEAEEAAARAAEEAAAKKAPAKEEPQVAADEFVVPEAAEFAVGASEEDEATPNAIEQLREKMAANKVAEIASETPEEFSGEKMDPLTDEVDENGVSFDITNTGNMKGKEVAELYIGKKDSKVFRAIKELKGFSKVEL